MAVRIRVESFTERSQLTTNLTMCKALLYTLSFNQVFSAGWAITFFFQYSLEVNASDELHYIFFVIGRLLSFLCMFDLNNVEVKSSFRRGFDRIDNFPFSINGDNFHNALSTDRHVQICFGLFRLSSNKVSLSC